MKIAPVLSTVKYNTFDEKLNDVKYWLAQPVVKRLEAVTFLVSQTVDLNAVRLDKTHVVKKKLKA